MSEGIGTFAEPTQTAIVEYIRRCPRTKDTIRSKEVADALGLHHRLASETMSELADNPDSPVGDKLDLRNSRWVIEHER